MIPSVRVPRGRHHRIAAAAAAIVLLVAAVASAEEFYPATSFFADGLTPQSSWEDILKTKYVKPDFPFVDFGGTYLPITALCVDRGMVRIADPRWDNGLRLSAAQLPGQWPGSATEPARTAAVGPAAVPGEPPVRYGVNVYKYFQNGFNATHLFLFEKHWDLPACPSA
jgi:hypothetical protein